VQERLVAAVVVLHGVGQLVAAQPGRVPEGLAQLGLEDPRIVEIVALGELLRRSRSQFSG